MARWRYDPQSTVELWAIGGHLCEFVAATVSVAGRCGVEYERLHLVATMPARRHPLRSHIVALFRRGDLVSVREAVLICDASRQAISKWLKAAGIDIEASRLAYIARQRSRAQLIAEGKPPRRKPTKAEMRATISDAMARTARNNSHF